MENVIGITEAKRRLNDICKRVQASGEEVVVLRHNAPVAKIVPLGGHAPTAEKAGAPRGETGMGGPNGGGCNGSA